ncbi:MAG: sigma-54 dependent transcriptional regulator, partial [Pseudomonadota bacterium]
LTAKAIHKYSRRSKGPFVAVNCAAIPDSLLESELFGYAKGAFTGADRDKLGLFSLADGGTIFLDEVGEANASVQAKLLRVLEERKFIPVGGHREVEVELRILAATHRNLEREIEQNRFREDLYYRLNVFPIELPPVRDRVEDIPILVTDLITRIEVERRGSLRLTSAALELLKLHNWPGNVRELANLIERLVILNPHGVVDAGDLPEKFQRYAPIEASNVKAMAAADVSVAQVNGTGSETVDVRLPIGGLDLKEYLNTLEHDLICQALGECGGVVAHAAKRLNMRRTTLVEKLRKYGLQRGDEVSSI